MVRQQGAVLLIAALCIVAGGGHGCSLLIAALCIVAGGGWLAPLSSSLRSARRRRLAAPLLLIAALCIVAGAGVMGPIIGPTPT